MKQLFLLLLLLLALTVANKAQNISFNDSALKSYLINELCVDTDGDSIYDADVDINNDQEIQPLEALAVQDLRIRDFPSSYFIRSILDISHFSNLKRLTLLSNDSLQFIAHLGLDSLNYFFLDGSVRSLTHIDLSDLVNITTLRIEGPMNLQYLNLQNGSFASDYFSLFYTENVQYACVDSIAAEYDEVAWHMASGKAPMLDCAVQIVETPVNSSELQIYPNPTMGDIYFLSDDIIKRIIIQDIHGRSYMIDDRTSNVINLSQLSHGLYFITVITEHETTTHKVYQLKN